MTRIAVFGGVYANPYALAALADDSRRARMRAAATASATSAASAPSATRSGRCSHELGVDDDRGQLRRRDRPRRRGLRLRLLRRARQPLRAAHVRLHAGAHVARVRRLDARAAAASCASEIGGVDVHMVHGSPLAVNDFLWESLDDDELRAARARPSGARRAALHAHRHPLAARGRRHAGRQRRRGRAPGERRPHGRLVRGARPRRRRDRARRARAARLRLARAGGVDARGRAARAVRRDDRDRLVDDLPGGRAAARARARRLPRLPRGAAGRFRRRRRGLGRRVRPVAARRRRPPGRLAVRHARCSRRGCGSTRTSTATSPATTAWWRARRRAQARAVRASASARSSTRRCAEGFRSST